MSVFSIMHKKSSWLQQKPHTGSLPAASSLTTVWKCYRINLCVIITLPITFSRLISTNCCMMTNPTSLRARNQEACAILIMEMWTTWLTWRTIYTFLLVCIFVIFYLSNTMQICCGGAYIFTKKDCVSNLSWDTNLQKLAHFLLYNKTWVSNQIRHAWKGMLAHLFLVLNTDSL